MEYLLIGVIVGLIMGMTGAGGALISIPLFLTLLDVSLKDATVLSLTAVLLGTGLNLISNFHRADKKIAFSFLLFGTMANYASLPLKKMTPDSLIAICLTVMGLYSLISVWRKQKKQSEATSGKLKIVLTGLLLGVVTTLTGLGGGVLLIPILKSFFGKTYSEALPTSLLTIFLISTVSLVLQFSVVKETIGIYELGLISVGVTLSVGLLKKGLGKLSEHNIDLLRKVVFSLVTIYSLGTVLLKTL